MEREREERTQKEEEEKEREKEKERSKKKIGKETEQVGEAERRERMLFRKL